MLAANQPHAQVTLPWTTRVPRGLFAFTPLKAFSCGQWIEPEMIASGLLPTE